MISGLFPHQHGVHHGSLEFNSVPDDETIQSDLPEHYHIGISANKYAGPAFGFDSFFDEFHEVASHSLLADGLNVDAFYNQNEFDGASEKYREFLRACFSHDNPFRSIINGLYATSTDRVPTLPIPRLTDDGARMIASTAKRRAQTINEPFFMFLNFMDAHGPHRPCVRYDSNLSSAPNSWDSGQFNKWDLNIDESASEEYTKYLRELYAASIEYLDRVVDDLIEDIIRSTARPTTIVITADHGENLGYEEEAGLFDHTSSLSEALLHVPLEILNLPADQASSPAEGERYLSHQHLRSMCTSFAQGEPFDEEWISETCGAEIVGMSGIGFGDREVTPSDQEYWNRMVRCRYEYDRKYVWDSLEETQVFEVNPKSPCQEYPVTEVEFDPTDIMEGFFDVPIGEFKSKVKEAGDDVNLDPQTQDRLEQLGYL